MDRLNHTDLAILRDFNIHESHVIQFRMEAFNVFNHAEFANPGGSCHHSFQLRYRFRSSGKPTARFAGGGKVPLLTKVSELCRHIIDATRFLIYSLSVAARGGYHFCNVDSFLQASGAVSR